MFLVLLISVPVVLVEDKTFSHVCEELVTHMKEELG